MISLIVSALLGVLSWPAVAASVTVYSKNLALVQEIRSLSLNSGINEARLTQIPATIDADSVRLLPVPQSEDVSVLEQSYSYDVGDPNALAQKYVGREITIVRPDSGAKGGREMLHGVLLSAAPQIIVRVLGRLYVNPGGEFMLPELPKLVSEEPTLLFSLDAAREGKADFDLSYLTSGLGWSAEYVISLDSGGEKADFAAWASIDNETGINYDDAAIKLVAGNVHRAEPQGGPRPMPIPLFAMRAAAPALAPDVSEQNFSDYHIYAIERSVSLPNGRAQRVKLASARGIAVSRVYLYEGAPADVFNDDTSEPQTDPDYGTDGRAAVRVRVEFENSTQAGLGLPLPAGRARVYEQDEEGFSDLSGEDSMGPSAEGSTVSLELGEAFDLSGERRRMNYVSDGRGRKFEESFEIVLRNGRAMPVSVIAREPLYRWRQWKIVRASQPWTKKNSFTIEFKGPVPAKGESVIDYTVRYYW